MRLFRRGDNQLAWWVVGTCVALYILSSIFSILTSNDSDQWLQMLLEPSLDTLIDMGIGGSLPLHQWNVWSLVTSTFLHANVLHILFNVLCLIEFFPVVTQQYGKASSFAIYTIAGVAGSLLSATVGEMYGLGASGGVFGLFGAMVAYGIRGNHPGRWAPVRRELLWLILNLTFGLAVSDQVSNAAHFGGLCGGCLAGLLIGPAREGTQDFFRSLIFSCCVVIVTASLAIGVSQGAWAAYLASWNRPAYDAGIALRRSAELDEKIRWTPNDATALYDRGSQNYVHGNFQDALKDFTAAAAITPNFDTLQFEAATLIKLSRFEDAVKIYDILIEKNPRNISLLNDRSFSQRRLFNNDKADADARAIVELEPVTADEFRMRGDAFRALRKTDDALADYNRSVELDESSPATYVARSSLLHELKQYDRSIADLNEAIASTPQDTDIYIMRADTLSDAGRFKWAAEDYTVAIDRGLNDARIWNGRAWSYFNIGKQKEALEDVQKSLKLRPDYPAALDTRGHIFEAMGQKEKAIVDYRAALAKDPTINVTRDALNRLMPQ